jgi:hypothetical protein
MLDFESLKIKTRLLLLNSQCVHLLHSGLPFKQSYLPQQNMTMCKPIVILYCKQFTIWNFV